MIERFFGRCYDVIGRAATGMRHDPAARGLSRDALCTAIASACIRAAALTIAPMDADGSDIDFFEGLLTQEVARFREGMRKRGIG